MDLYRELQNANATGQNKVTIAAASWVDAGALDATNEMLMFATVATEIHARWIEKGRKFTHLGEVEDGGAWGEVEDGGAWGGQCNASPFEHGEHAGGGVGGGIIGDEW
jgi:hypothetical protein